MFKLRLSVRDPCKKKKKKARGFKRVRRRNGKTKEESRGEGV